MDCAVIKVLVFVASLVVLFVLEGIVPPPDAFSFSRHGSPWLIFTVAYVYGAILAIWGDKTIGILHPISYRWVYIAGGVFLMLLILSLVLCGRGLASHQPNKPDAADPARTLQLPARSQWRRVADPGSAGSPVRT